MSQLCHSLVTPFIIHGRYPQAMTIADNNQNTVLPAGKHLLVGIHHNGEANGVESYAQQVCHLLGGLLGKAPLVRGKLAPGSLLFVRLPRWPIKRVLLIVQAEETEEAAVDWVGRLSRATDITLTILAIVPSLVFTSNGGNAVSGLDTLLSPTTPPGRRLRRLVQRLSQWQVQGTLRLRQGEPERQIYQEVAEGNYDLIIIAAEPHEGVKHDE